MIWKRATRVGGLCLGLAVIFVAAAALGAPQQSGGRLGRGVPDEPGRDSKPGAVKPKAEFALSDEELAAAAAIKPVPVEALEARIPRQLAGFEWLSGEGKTSRLGPASGTVVRARYALGDKRLEAELVDPGGLPAVGPYYLEMLPEGERRQQGVVALEGLRIGGFPAALAAAPPGSVSKLQLALGPRIRLTLSTSSASNEELRAAAAAFDLSALADMAPEGPPGPAASEED